MNKEKYSELKTFFSCYFNQDWDLDYEDPDSVIKAYVFRTYSDYVEAVLVEIQKLENDPLNSTELDKFIDYLGCDYYYQDDMTSQQWLNYVSDTIKKYLAEKEKL